MKSLFEIKFAILIVLIGLSVHIIDSCMLTVDDEKICDVDRAFNKKTNIDDCNLLGSKTNNIFKSDNIDSIYNSENISKVEKIEDLKILKKDILFKNNTKVNDSQFVKVTLCAIGKNENLYIREWVEWYKNLGVSKIILYDNNDIDGEKFEDVINNYIESGFIKIINRRGKVKTNAKVGIKELKKGKSVQGEAYHHCYYHNYKNSDWMFFFDIDEFLAIDFKYDNLFDFLNDFSKYDGIKVQWRLYGDNGHLHYENKTLNERFLSKDNESYSNMVKTILKCKKYNYHLFFSAHGVYNKRPYFVNLKKKRVKYYLKDEKSYKDLPVYLNHFYSKSTEEYIKRKYMKSDASFGVNKDKNFSLTFVKNNYFSHNKYTEEKDNMFNSLIENKN